MDTATGYRKSTKNAVDYYLRALDVYPTLDNTTINHREHVITIKLLGYTFLKTEQYEKAEEYIQKGITLSCSQSLKPYDLMIEIHNLMEGMFEKVGSHDKAAECLVRKKAIHRERVVNLNPQAFVDQFLSSLSVTVCHGSDSDAD